MKTFLITEPFIRLNCGLSEGPYYEADNNVLRFVDIVNHTIHRVNLYIGPSSIETIKYDESIGVTADIKGDSDNILVGSKYGIALTSKTIPSSFNLTHPFSPSSPDKQQFLMRANDGAVDPLGRFWLSSIRDPLLAPFLPVGALYRLNLDGSLHQVLSNVTIGNGISWSDDGRTMYFTETADRKIYAYDFDQESGEMTNKTVFFSTEEGGPDGHARDVQGNFWVAVWGSWKVLRVSVGGEVTAEVKVPTRCPTAVAFVGEDIYITSEAEPEPEKYPESVKYGGNVFKCHVGVRGRELFKADIDGWRK